MKNLTKKLLSLLFVFILAATTLVPAFAYKADNKDILDFSVGFESSYNVNIETVSAHISNIYTGFAGENSCRFKIYNEDGVISSSGLCRISKDEDNVLWLIIEVLGPTNGKIKNFSKETTFVIEEGAFVTADNQLSPEMSVSFLPNEFSPLSARFFNPFKILFAAILTPLKVILLIPIFGWLPALAFLKIISFGLID